jgi:hypothetical protein
LGAGPEVSPGKIEGACAKGSLRLTSSKKSRRPSKPWAGSLVGEKPLSVREVIGLEREPERDQLDDHNRVERRPRRHVGLGQLERGVLGGERVRRDPSVDAVRVRVENGATLRRDRGLRAQGSTAKLEKAGTIVERMARRTEFEPL